MNRYGVRSFRFLELCEFGEWRFKLYGIAFAREFPRPELIAAAKQVASADIGQFEANDLRVGFIGVHDGKNAAFVFVDFWGNENELFHRVFLARDSRPDHLVAATESDASACVWDLKLQAFERDAFVKHMLMHPDAPDFDGYLNERLNADL